MLLANTCFRYVHKIGMPEARIPLSECVIYLATSPKSNSAYKAIDEAMATVRQTGNLPVPFVFAKCSDQTDERAELWERL